MQLGRLRPRASRPGRLSMPPATRRCTRASTHRRLPAPSPRSTRPRRRDSARAARRTRRVARRAPRGPGRCRRGPAAIHAGRAVAELIPERFSSPSRMRTRSEPHMPIRQPDSIGDLARLGDVEQLAAHLRHDRGPGLNATETPPACTASATRKSSSPGCDAACVTSVTLPTLTGGSRFREASPE
jgi:hypothetical protein